jgi:S-adenosyl methyltransferase
MARLANAHSRLDSDPADVPVTNVNATDVNAAEQSVIVRDEMMLPIRQSPTTRKGRNPVTADSAGIDTTVAHPARRYNYWLGGKDNFAADRASAAQIEAVYPSVRVTARENRKFLRRTVKFLAGEAGVRQFLDIGTGLPSADNTHEVAQRVAPDARIVYVDNDPLVMTHARALLTTSDKGATTYLERDLRRPHEILADAQLRDTLDLEQPVAVMLIAVVHFLRDDAEAADVISTLVDALAPGSYLVLTHATFELNPELADRLAAMNVDFVGRTRQQVTALIPATLTPVEPGLVVASHWRRDEDDAPDDAEVACYGVVARKSHH